MFKYHELDDCRKKDLQLVEKKKNIWLTLPQEAQVKILW